MSVAPSPPACPPNQPASWPRRDFLQFVAAAVGALFFVFRLHGAPKPLWSGARYTEGDRDAAIERGLQFIDRIASNPRHFSRWGHDLLLCFYTISNTAKNAKLRAMAYSMAEHYAQQWRHDHPDPPTGDPDALFLFVTGAEVADCILGVDPALKQRTQLAAQRFSAVDFLKFDPLHEPPPKDIPELCSKCGYQNPRGVTVCQKCQTTLTFRDPYDLWLDSLIITHQGDAYGVKLGASYPEALQWISKMRPYPAPGDDEQAFNDVAYAITHVIYTLNDYHTYRLTPAWLPQEFRYLKSNIREAESYEDWELVGEFMDALRAFGEDESAPEIRAATNYLLSHQNPDGSWGDMNDDDIYTRYHTTWTAVDGLRQYSFRAEHLRFPEMLPLLQGKTVLQAPIRRGQAAR